MPCLYRSNKFLNVPWKSFCVSVSMTFVTASFISSTVLLRQPLSIGNNQMDGVEDWCIVWVEMPLSRFSECSPLPELPYNLNILTLTLTLWPISSGVLTSLLLPYLSSSLTDSVPSLNLLCHSKTDAWFMQDGRKAVWSIPYVFVAFFPSLKQNFIAYRSSKVSSCPNCIFEIDQLRKSGFSRVYYNCCFSCSFEPEIKKIGHKMYSNNILNFPEWTPILNACTKKSGYLLKAPRIYVYIYI